MLRILFSEILLNNEYLEHVYQVLRSFFMCMCVNIVDTSHGSVEELMVSVANGLEFILDNHKYC